MSLRRFFVISQFAKTMMVSSFLTLTSSCKTNSTSSTSLAGETTHLCNDIFSSEMSAAHDLKTLITAVEAKSCNELMEKLPNIESLNLDNTGFKRLDYLQTAKNLRSLHLRNNGLRTLEHIDKITQLEELNIDENQVEDLTPLSSLKSLSVLSARFNLVSSITPLSKNQKLYFLALDSNNISDISPLFELRELALLDLRNNPIFARKKSERCKGTRPTTGPLRKVCI